MSAIHDDAISTNPVITRYTEVKLEIISHTTGKHVLTQDVNGFEISKTDKETGQAAFSLLPSRNWLNFIFPDDLVNFYVDRGDGRGFVRTFFGYIDSVRESSSRDASGASNTIYKLNCSDFQKAFERTQIYFNPALNPDRGDIDGKWIGAFNMGGLALATMGVQATGSPPDALLSLIYLFLGSSGQYALPDGFSPLTSDKFKKQRVDYAISLIKSSLQRLLPNGVSLDDFVTAAVGASRSPQNSITLSDQMIKDLGADPSDADNLASITKALNLAVKELNNPKIGVGVSTGKTILDGISTQTLYKSLLDVIDTTAFIEREAIDGYMDNVAVWQNDGSIMNFLTAVINDPVNQLIFDLRPVQYDASTRRLSAGTSWSTEADDTGGNHEKGRPDGVQYVPAVIFREYPFSTITELDLTNVKLNLKDAKGSFESVGKFVFGSIFSDAPNTPGRHIVTIPNINLEDTKSSTDINYLADLILKDKLEGVKHIDVAVIMPHEIISSDFGRSDNEVFNLLQIYSDALLGEQERLFTTDIMPIITPISITRHGLRVKEVTTSMARFYGTNSGTTAVDEDTAAEEEKAATPEDVQFSGNISYPMDSYRVSCPYAKWRTVDDDFGNKAFWRLHQGIDLVAPLDTPVKAIADGWVVAVAPVGSDGFKAYGNTVVIEHANKYKDKKVYSVYAHLNGFAADLLSKTNPQKNSKSKACTAQRLGKGGSMPAVPVKAGEVIGYCGNTDYPSQAQVDTKLYPKGKPKMGVHLHLEVTSNVPSKVGGPSMIPYTGPTPPPPPDFNSMWSMSPVEFFAAAGLDLNHPGSVASGDANDDGQDDSDPQDDSDHSGSQNSSPDTVDDSPGKVLDTAQVRNQAIRWGLLIDHWNQHNSEYLSGSITMRGAPEIRVGYRLDVQYPDGPLSFYVQGVSHSWRYGDKMTTTLTVTRGQLNNAFPQYVLPSIKGLAEGQRQAGSRLGENFTVGDNLPPANGGYMVSGGGIKPRPYRYLGMDELDATAGTEVRAAANTSVKVTNTNSGK